MNLLAGKRDPLDFFLLALRSGYFFPGKLIINQKALKRYQLVARKRNKAFSKIWSLSTPERNGITGLSINLLVVYRESVILIGYITRRLSADSQQL